MRFSLRAFFVAVALACAFLGGRASVSPLLKQHEQRQRLLDQELQTHVKLRPILQIRDTNHKRETAELWAKVDKLSDQLRKAEAERKSRFNNLLAFPVNTERAMLGEGRE